MGDGEFVGFGGTFVGCAWGGGGEVGDIDRFPDAFAGLGVVDLAGELDGGVPDAVG